MVRLRGLFLRYWFDGNAQLDPVVEAFELLNARELLSEGLNALELADLHVEGLNEVTLCLLVLHVAEGNSLQAVLELLGEP